MPARRLVSVGDVENKLLRRTRLLPRNRQPTAQAVARVPYAVKRRIAVGERPGCLAYTDYEERSAIAS